VTILLETIASSDQVDRYIALISSFWPNHLKEQYKGEEHLIAHAIITATVLYKSYLKSRTLKANLTRKIYINKLLKAPKH
jgi:hypothetical protein